VKKTIDSSDGGSSSEGRGGTPSAKQTRFGGFNVWNLLHTHGKILRKMHEGDSGGARGPTKEAIPRGNISLCRGVEKNCTNEKDP